MEAIKFIFYLELLMTLVPLLYLVPRGLWDGVVGRRVKDVEARVAIWILLVFITEPVILWGIGAVWGLLPVA